MPRCLSHRLYVAKVASPAVELAIEHSRAGKPIHAEEGRHPSNLQTRCLVRTFDRPTGRISAFCPTIATSRTWLVLRREGRRLSMWANRAWLLLRRPDSGWQQQHRCHWGCPRWPPRTYFRTSGKRPHGPSAS